MDLKLVSKKVSLKELEEMAKDMFGDFVKAVVDIEKGVMVVNGELHADEEAYLLEKGSKQKDLWGINLYPEVKGKGWIEFDSMINVRPSVGNNSRSVEDAETKKLIVKIVSALVEK